MAHRQQCDLVVEFDEPFDNDLAGTGAATALRMVPGALDVARAAHDALALAGARHHGFHDARRADRGDGGAVLVECRSKTIR